MKTGCSKPQEAWAAQYALFVGPPCALLPSDGDDSSPEAPRSEPMVSSHDASSELDDCSSRIGRKCASRDCSFLVHSHPSFGDFCCKKCEKNSGGRHGKKCERRAYREAAPSSPRPSQTSKLPRRMLKSEEVAFRSGAVAVGDWRDASEPDCLSLRVRLLPKPIGSSMSLCMFIPSSVLLDIDLGLDLGQVPIRCEPVWLRTEC